MVLRFALIFESGFQKLMTGIDTKIQASEAIGRDQSPEFNAAFPEPIRMQHFTNAALPNSSMIHSDAGQRQRVWLGTVEYQRRRSPIFPYNCLSGFLEHLGDITTLLGAWELLQANFLLRK